jgi:teichuronic acid exporter
MEVERQAIAGLKWMTIAKLSGQGVSWVVTLIVLRLLSPADYGLMAISAVIISIMAGVAEFGLGASLVQSRTLDERELARLSGALAALNLGCGLVVLASAPLVAELFRDPRLVDVIRVSSLQFVLNAIDAVPKSLAQRGMRFGLIAGIELGATVLASVATLVLAYLGAGVWALVLGNLAGGVLRTALYVAQGTGVWPSFAFRGIGRHLRFGGAVTAARMFWQVAHQVDVLIAGRFLTDAAVGFYAVSLHLATLPMQRAMSIVNQVAFPTMARLQDEALRLHDRLLQAIRLLGFAAIPVLWGISAVAPEFVDVVLGEKWRAAILPLEVLSLVAPLRMLTAFLATALAAVGRADLELRNTIVSSVILPIAFLIGVQWLLDGLALSWLVAMPVVLAINFPRTSRALGLDAAQVFAALRAPLLAGAAMYGAVLGVRLLLAAQEALLRLPLLIVVGAGAYLAAVSVLDRSVWSDVKRVASALRT